MNKYLLTVALSVLGVGAAMAGVKVAGLTKIETGDVPAHNPVLSPDASTLLFSADDQTGLNIINLATGVITDIEKDVRGAGFAPVFSPDGKSVIYQTAEVIDGLMNRDVRSYSITDGQRAMVAPMSRADIDLNAQAGTSRYARSNFSTIVINNDGATAEISPVADAHSYLWPSFSPDGKHLAFVEPFQGLFVANADGSDAVKIADKADFPAWADNNTIVYVTSHDDGYTILDSTLFAIDINSGKIDALTDADTLVGESTAANGTVVFTKLDGTMYKFTLTR